jgi:hypothetical protein
MNTTQRGELVRHVSEAELEQAIGDAWKRTSPGSSGGSVSLKISLQFHTVPVSETTVYRYYFTRSILLDNTLLIA